MTGSVDRLPSPPLAGMFGAYRVSLALIERGRTGVGSRVDDVPMVTRQAPPSRGDHDDRIDEVWVTEGVE